MSLRNLLPVTLSLLFSSFYPIDSLQAAPTTPLVQASHLSVFQQEFNQVMEGYLRNKLGRAPIGFSLVVRPLSSGIVKLELPGHLQRDTFLQLTLDTTSGQPVLQGKIYSQTEKDLLLKAVSKAFGPIKSQHIEVFPFQSVAKDFGITKINADLYVKPLAIAGENLATQARLGTPVRLLDYSQDGKFALVRVEDDGYIAWIQRKDLIEGDQNWFNDWLARRQVLIMHPIRTPMDIPIGTRLKLLKDNGQTVLTGLPDGRQLTLNKIDIVFSHPGNLPSSDSVLKTAFYYLPKASQGGGAYLWGGTFGVTLDCSGFVQTVYRLNGVYLPRDADQQKNFTQRVGNTLAQLNELKPGDLVFFSGNGKYPTHVGLYIGHNQIIHSSPKGPYSGVKISTLSGGGDYDKFLQSIYFGGGRVTRSL